MTAEETVLEKVKVLPPNRKRGILGFVEFLESKEANGEDSTADAAIGEVSATRKLLLERLAEKAK